jgi:hypothetical protein
MRGKIDVSGSAICIADDEFSIVAFGWTLEDSNEEKC